MATEGMCLLQGSGGVALCTLKTCLPPGVFGLDGPSGVQSVSSDIGDAQVDTSSQEGPCVERERSGSSRIEHSGEAKAVISFNLRLPKDIRSSF